MNILLSNDDGYRAPGLLALAAELARHARVIIVAPDRDRSGASNSLTLDVPIRAERIDRDFFRVFGTPTDCVHLAIAGLLEQEPDLVVAGVNHGANLGDDVLYSGTVAAATEGRFLGLPAIAVSIAAHEPRHLATAATIGAELALTLREAGLASGAVLNVNVPDLPRERIAGIRATRLGSRHKSEPVVPIQDPLGRTMYWVGPAGPEQDAGEGTDFHAVRNAYVSVTPLHADLTRHAALAPLGEWLARLPRIADRA